MKKIILSLAILLSSVYGIAQKKLAFPFQGGKEVMVRFFKDSLAVSPEIIRKKATGLVVFKFTADEKGKISKIIIYYADDAVLVQPVIDALKKSNHKWIIPDHEKLNDFIIPVSFRFNTPAVENEAVQKSVYDFNRNRRPIFSGDQVPLDLATLLPAVTINYDIPD